MGDEQRLPTDELLRASREDFDAGTDFTVAVEEEYPERLRHLASFETGDVADLQVKLRELLALGDGDRSALRAAARRAVVRRWSWASIGARLVEPVR